MNTGIGDPLDKLLPLTRSLLLSDYPDDKASWDESLAALLALIERMQAKAPTAARKHRRFYKKVEIALDECRQAMQAIYATAP